jgi:hypothetical protein
LSEGVERFEVYTVQQRDGQVPGDVLRMVGEVRAGFAGVLPVIGVV